MSSYYTVKAVHKGTQVERTTTWKHVLAFSKKEAIQHIQDKEGDSWPPGTYWSAKKETPH